MAVTRFEITSRGVAAIGASFRATGQYEFIRGILHFAVDPTHPSNALIADIDLPPKDEDGRVHFSADAQVYRPLGRGNGALLADVLNRGSRTTPGFNLPRGADNPFVEPQVGDGFLMRSGFTLAFVGWQMDVPDGRLRLNAPEAVDSRGRRLVGQAHQQFDPPQDCSELLLSDQQHKPLPSADLADPSAVLPCRDWADGPATVVPRDQCSFARWTKGGPVPDANYVCLAQGFEAGQIYEIIYATISTPVIGLGFLALRDSAAFIRYGSAAEGNPSAGSIDRAHIYGASQSGRMLRELLYLGPNADEAGRVVYDGAMPHIASSRLGEFNFRFGQPSSNHVRNVGNQRALTYSTETDPITGEADGLLRCLEAAHAVPKIIATNSGAEYWWSGASLTRTDATGSRDIELPANVRIYQLAGTKHGPGSLPLSDAPMAGPRQQHLSNTVDYRPLQRALLIALDRWVKDGMEPAPSRMPRIAEGTAVRREHLADFFRSVPGLGFPKDIPQRRRLDYGPEMAKGVPAYPPKEGAPYGVLVSAVDSHGNEVAGIRHPDLRVPPGTYTGWNMRHPESLGSGHFVPLQGAVVPLTRTKDEGRARGDHRHSIEERYASQQDALDRVRQASEDLVREGLLLAADNETMLEGASARWEAFMKVRD